jgi:ubiquinone/menaquinone biosynthesis C-methylase UbiE
MLHARQVAAIRKILRERRPKRLLEIAPGPARVTRDIEAEFTGTGILIDASAQMLHEARRGLRGPHFRCIQGDAFRLPCIGQFDLVYSFRLIRHFDIDERVALYRQMGACLKPGGVLVFDVVNAAVSAPLRANAAPGEYEHFDALQTAEQLRTEVEEAGLHVTSLEGVQRRYGALRQLQIYVAPRSARLARGLMEAIDRVPGGAPLEWIAVCRKP